ncbi:General transcription factor II-I repeat domain-containing protein 2B, partial [Ooceraea biroi]
LRCTLSLFVRGEIQSLAVLVRSEIQSATFHCAMVALHFLQLTLHGFAVNSSTRAIKDEPGVAVKVPPKREPDVELVVPLIPKREKKNVIRSSVKRKRANDSCKRQGVKKRCGLNWVRSPVHDTTTGLEIFLAVEESLTKFGVDFSKCSSIATDGARAMIGSNIEFAGQIKQRNLNIPIIHCIIHQEVLSGKVIKLSTAMETVTKIINAVKGGHKFLTHRKFQLFLQENNAVYTDIPLYCPVRRFSAAKCLEIFFAIRNEILLFLKEMKNPKFQEYISLLEDVAFLSELAFITDMTNKLRLLNLKLQRPDQNILQLVSHINSFRRKLQLLKFHLNNDNFHFFPSCQILLTEYGSNCNFKEYIHFVDSLIDEFDTRFACFKALKTEFILFENPLTAAIEEQCLELQDESCDLQNDISLQTVKETGVDFYKKLKKSSYPKLRDFGLRIYSMFGSTYLCETSFSKMKLIKNEKRSSLNNNSLPRLMRIATSNLKIDIPSLAIKRSRMSD